MAHKRHRLHDLLIICWCRFLSAHFVLVINDSLAGGGAHTGRLCKQHLMLKDHLEECGDCVGEMSHSFWKCFFFFFSTSQGRADDGPDESQIWCGSWWLSSNTVAVGRVTLNHRYLMQWADDSRYFCQEAVTLCNRESAEFKRFNKTILCVSLYLLPLLP